MHKLLELFNLEFDPKRGGMKSSFDPCMFFNSVEGFEALKATYVDDYFIALYVEPLVWPFTALPLFHH